MADCFVVLTMINHRGLNLFPSYTLFLGSCAPNAENLQSYLCFWRSFPVNSSSPPIKLLKGLMGNRKLAMPAWQTL